MGRGRSARRVARRLRGDRATTVRRLGGERSAGGSGKHAGTGAGGMRVRVRAGLRACGRGCERLRAVEGERAA